jgi:hypothetical protein
MWLLCFMLLWIAPAYAATYHVATTGSDGVSCANADFTPDNTQAKATIQAGINCACNSGASSPCSDTIIVHNGTYGAYGQFYEIPSVSGSNLGSGAITLKAAPGETVWLRGMIDMWNHSAAFWIIDGINVDNGGGSSSSQQAFTINSFVRLQNLEAKNAYSVGILTSHHTELLNVRSHGHGQQPGSSCINEPGQCHGVYSHDGNVLIDGGEYYDNNGHGVIFTYVESGQNIVRNNKVHGNSRGGITYIVGPDTPLIYNNVIYNSDASGMQLIDGAFQVYNNTFYGNSGEAILNESGTAGSIIQNNIIYNNGGTISTTSGITFTNNLVGIDPDFANAPGDDFHLKNTSDAINAGTNLAGVPTDIEGNPRVGATDIGAYECQNLAGVDCTSTPPQPIGPIVNYKCDGNFLDDENGFTATQTGGVLSNGAPLVSGNSCVFDGVDAVLTAPNDAAFRAASFGFAKWSQITTPPAEYCHFMRVGNTAVMGLGSDGTFFCFVNNGPTVVSSTSVLGAVHLLGCGYDAASGMLRLWLDSANPSSMNIGAGTPLVYGGTETLEIGGIPGEPGHFCQFNGENFRMNDEAWTALGMQQIYNERVPAMGTTHTSWRFYSNNAPEGTTIPGQGVNAPRIVQARNGTLLMGVNAKRNGSTVNQHYSLECNLNGGAFATLTNSCASNPACITTDSVKNMGDATSDLGDISGGGFTFVPGRYVVDNIDSGMATILEDGQFTVWRYGLAFRQTLSDGDEITCRPRGPSGVFDSYPPVLAVIEMDAPGLAGGAARSEGGQSRGGMRR